MMVAWLEPWFRQPAAVLLLPGLAVLVLYYLAQRLYFDVLPRRATEKYQKADPERLSRYLERVVATPSFLGPAPKLATRATLAGIYLGRGQHLEAAGHFRATLADLAKVRHIIDRPALEADTRRRLADCLEGLGQLDEAKEERRLAEACVDQAPDDPLSHLASGTLLEREHRYAEACDAFERALALTPESDRPVRVQCLTRLTLACFNAGRPEESLKWAEEIIALGAEAGSLRTAHRMAGVACGQLGRLEESEEHDRRAYDLAAAEGDTGAMGSILATLADIQRKRGKLDEANEACNRARAVDPKAARMVIAVQAMILQNQGRFEDALAMLGRHAGAGKVVIPALERRSGAARSLDMARIAAEGGRGEEARARIEEAIAVFGNDAKLGLKCDAAAAWVFAVRGLADDSRRVADEVEARLPEFERDPSTVRGALHNLGMAAWTRGDHEDGEDCWGRYLDLTPDPVYRPTAHYARGECRRHRGDILGAIADLRAAVAMGIDTHHARLARRRLGELTLS